MGELIEVGRLNLAAVATQVGISHVVDHDDDDVGTFVGGRANGSGRASCKERDHRANCYLSSLRHPFIPHVRSLVRAR